MINHLEIDNFITIIGIHHITNVYRIEFLRDWLLLLRYKSLQTTISVNPSYYDIVVLQALHTRLAIKCILVMFI